MTVLGDHPEAVEASLLQAYAPRDPLREFFRGEITLRQLRIMVEWLPLDAPAHRAQNGHAWRDEHVLTWDVSTQLRILNAALANMFRAKGEPPVTPEPLPSPAAGAFSDGDVVDEAEQREVRSNMERLWGT